MNADQILSVIISGMIMAVSVVIAMVRISKAGKMDLKHQREEDVDKLHKMQVDAAEARKDIEFIKEQLKELKKK